MPKQQPPVPISRRSLVGPAVCTAIGLGLVAFSIPFMSTGVGAIVVGIPCMIVGMAILVPAAAILGIRWQHNRKVL